MRLSNEAVNNSVMQGHTSNSEQSDALTAPDTGRRVVRGSTVRGAGYFLGTALTAIASVFLLRHLGVVAFGQFVTVVSIIAIVTQLSDVGLATIGQREYVLRETEAEKRRLLANLLGIRLAIAPVGALLAIAFTLIAGYPSVMIWGTALAGAGFIIFMAQASLTVPLAVDLRLVALTTTEVIRQIVTVIGYMLLVIAGASLLPFLAVSIPASFVGLVATVVFVGRLSSIRPQLNWGICRKLLGQSMPVALALAVNVIYFRLMIIMMSLLATGFATGLFATSFRMLEIMIGIPVLMVITALPVLSRAAQQDHERLRYILQKMTEAALLAACYLILVILITAGPVIELIGGAQYEGAAPILRILSLALLGAFMGQVWQMALISIHRQSALIISNTFAFITVFVLGIVLIEANGATGAAIATAVGEVVLAAATLLMLVRHDRKLVPNFSFCPKVFIATGLAATTFFIPSLHPFITAGLATLVFWGSAYVLRALPREALEAFFKQDRDSITTPSETV